MVRPSFLASVAGTAALVQAQQQICNNAASLCNRKYNEITHLGAHDSPFVRTAANDYTIFGNQYFDSTTQLDAGVRLLTAQVHQNGASWDLCHSACGFLNAGSLTTWLGGIKTWLDGHADDVVTVLLVNADNANASTLHAQFEAADIVDYAYTPESTNSPTPSWPTLADMISTNKRLVVWIASLDPSSNTVAPYLLDQFTFVFENNYDISDPAAFPCEPDRPSSLRGQEITTTLSRGYLPLMNHFLYNRIGSGAGAISFPAEDKVQNTNAADGSIGNLGAHASNCTEFYGGRRPTYVLTDFFNVARAIDTVDRLNNVTGQTEGRRELPDTVEGSKSGASVSGSGSGSNSTSTSSAAATSTPAEFVPSGTGAGSASIPSPTPTVDTGSGGSYKFEKKYAVAAAAAAPVLGMLAVGAVL